MSKTAFLTGNLDLFACSRSDIVTVFLQFCTLCLKNVPPLTSYNLDTHGSIAIIFGTNVTEKVGNQNLLYFLTSPN